MSANYVFNRWDKNGLTDLPKNGSSVKLYYQSARFLGISLKETRENAQSVFHFVLMLMSWS